MGCPKKIVFPEPAQLVARSQEKYVPDTRITDLSGRTFTRLTVTGFSHKRNSKCGTEIYYWKCVCSCGNSSLVQTSKLKQNVIKSCGCLNNELRGKSSITHGLSKTPEFKIWGGIKKRTTNPKCKSFHNYGGRGIKMSSDWMESFESFYTAMGPRPSSKHSIDRIDNNGDYCKENCRWATQKEQMRNVRFNINLTAKGKTQCVAAWASETGVKPGTIAARLKKGWSIDKALQIKPKSSSLPRISSDYMISVGEETHTLKEWSKILHINPPVLRKRIRSGWTPEESVSSLPRRYGRYLTVKNRTLCINAWAKISGIGATTITKRVDCGWEPEKAIFQTPRNKERGVTNEL